MPRLIDKPTRIEAAGNKPKLIDESVGRVNNGQAAVSIAHMRSPAGWIEPGQTPEFDEYTIVLRGMLRVESRDGRLDVHAGQAVVVRRSEWVRYRTPGQECVRRGQEAACVRPRLAHRSSGRPVSSLANLSGDADLPIDQKSMEPRFGHQGMSPRDRGTQPPYPEATHQASPHACGVSPRWYWIWEASPRRREPEGSGRSRRMDSGRCYHRCSA